MVRPAWRGSVEIGRPTITGNDLAELSPARGVYIAVAMQMGANKAAAIINVTPMIDILLVLLIVFMLLPTKTVGLKSDVPQLPTENQPAIPNPQHLVLRIQEDRSMDINSQPVVLAELQERLRTLFAVRPDGVLFVNGAAELQFEDVATVIDIAHGAGVQRIGVLTEKVTAAAPRYH
jgi:biopolymer transport protein TolR